MVFRNNTKKFTTIQTNNSGSSNSNNLITKSLIPTFQSCSTIQSGNVISYSIPKQERFLHHIKRDSCDSIYTLPEMKGLRSTTMGFGYRQEFINKKEVDAKPSPNKYNLLSVFSENINKERGCSISNKINYKENKARNMPGPCDYNNAVSFEWVKKTPCSMKFRNDFFYQDDIKKMHNVSPMKYYPDTKIVENSRYRNNSVGFGFGLLNYQVKDQMDKIPGPGRYYLPSIFDKRKTGKIPLN